MKKQTQKYTEEQSILITQFRAILIKGMKKDLELLEQGKYLNDPRIIQMWSILNDFEKEIKDRRLI